MFIPYSTIHNFDNQTTLDYFVGMYPELHSVEYVIHEKLHGCNIQLHFTPNAPMQVGRREDYLTPGESFYDVWNTLKKYPGMLQLVQEYSNIMNEDIRLYGELHGVGVVSGNPIRYAEGAEKQLLFFDAMLGSEMLPQLGFYQLMAMIGLSASFIVPQLGKAPGLAAALAWNHEFDSKVLSVPGNEAEGVVIQPWLKNYYLPVTNHRFVLKKKTEKYREVSRPKEKKERDTTVQELFNTYANENRMQSYFSKHGPITEKRDMGKYVAGIRADAVVDLIADHPEHNLETLRAVNSKPISDMLLATLAC